MQYIFQALVWPRNMRKLDTKSVLSVWHWSHGSFLLESVYTNGGDLVVLLSKSVSIFPYSKTSISQTPMTRISWLIRTRF